MSRAEQILKETYKHHFRDLEYDELNLAAMEQTAIEFSKWKDENYIQYREKYMHRMLYQTTKITDPLFINHLKTTEELYELWNNLNQTT